MTDYNTGELDRYQGIVDRLAEQEAALELYREEFSEMLMQEYSEDNHKLSWLVAEWLGDSSDQLEGYVLSSIKDPDFDMSEVWRDWLTDKFVALADSMDSKEIDAFQQEYF